MKNKKYNLDINKILGFKLVTSEINSECKLSSQYGAKISQKVGQKQPPAPAV